MGYSKSFNYDKVILNTGQFAYGIQNLIATLLEYSEVPTISRRNEMPDGVNVNISDLTYKDLEDVSDLSKQNVTINFTHKINGWYYINFTSYFEGITVTVQCESALQLNQIDEVVKAILSSNFSKSAFDKKIRNMSNINVNSKNQEEENASQKLEPIIDLSNANLKNSTINISNDTLKDSTLNPEIIAIEKSSSKNSWSWINVAAAAITIIAGAIAIWQFYLEP